MASDVAMFFRFIKGFLLIKKLINKCLPVFGNVTWHWLSSCDASATLQTVEAKAQYAAITVAGVMVNLAVLSHACSPLFRM